MSTTMTIRIDKDVKQRLNKLAQASQRSKSFLAADAIQQYLQQNEWQLHEINNAISEADNEEFATSDEVEFIALENPQAAKNIVKKIINAVNALTENPAMGKPGRITGTRELIVAKTPYLIPYLFKNNSKEKKSKILYDVNNIAAMHSQKIGNAIRTIDTWYPEYEQHQRAISIDPYGAVTNLGKAFRQPKKNQDFFSLFDQFSQGEQLASPEEEHFVMAVLVRGGVFGEKQ